MNALYNEIDPFASAWLDRLIEQGHVGPGRVERRSIADLTPDDVAGPGQRHFFAGIGGWSYALRIAGVPDDADVWTGSCPCQPFSDAGKGLGVLDPRHLWPAWFALIEQCRPPVIFGEQVASRDGLQWLDLVFADLERCGYAVGAADLCAAGVAAPHLRQRIYFVAYANEAGRGELGEHGLRQNGIASRRSDPDRRCQIGGMADAMLARRPEGRAIARGDSIARGGGSRRLAFSNEQRLEESKPERFGLRERDRTGDASGIGPWSPCEWVYCRPIPGHEEGTYRPVEPGAFPLADGISARVGRLRGYGNAIVPQLAAAFIRCAMSTRLESGEGV